MYNITIIVKSLFLKNHNNGIITFIKNLINFKNFNIFIYSDEIIKTKYFETTNNKEIIYLSDLIITNCEETCSWFIDLNINKKHIFFTHIPDILNKKSSIYNFLKKHKEIIIGTQSRNLKRLLKSSLKNKVIYLGQPICNSNYFFDNIFTGDVIIISSSENRKNYDLMLESLSETNLKTTIICGNSNKIISKIQKNKIKVKIINSINNIYVPSIIRSHKLMLHMSKEEIYPYSVYESLLNNVPVIINKNSIWGKCFDTELTGCILCNEDILSIKNNINNILNNKIKIDNSYMYDKVYFNWNNYLKHI